MIAKRTRRKIMVQYILTEEEYTELKKKQKYSLELSKNKLQNLCTHIADNLVLTTGWAKGNPWGCILSTDHEHYCDECPVQDICPSNKKTYSK